MLRQYKLETATNGVIVSVLNEWGNAKDRFVFTEPDDFLRWCCEVWGMTQEEMNEAVIRFAHWQNAEKAAANVMDADFAEVE